MLRRVLVFVLGATASLIVACSSSSSGDGCASGVYADGQCLVAHAGGSGGSAGSGAGGSTLEGTVPGAACAQPRELTCGHAVDGSDIDRVLVCDGGLYADALPCAAPSTCSDLAGHTSVHCGPPDDVVPYAFAGDPCTPEQAAACPLDRSALLVCAKSIWVTAQACGAGTTCHRTGPATMGAGWSCPSTSTNGCVVCE